MRDVEDLGGVGRTIAQFKEAIAVLDLDRTVKRSLQNLLQVVELAPKTRNTDAGHPPDHLGTACGRIGIIDGSSKPANQSVLPHEGDAGALEQVRDELYAGLDMDTQRARFEAGTLNRAAWPRPGAWPGDITTLPDPDQEHALLCRGCD